MAETPTKHDPSPTAAPRRPAAPARKGNPNAGDGPSGHGSDETSDATLLQRFVARRDQAAFAALVRRHGPMVLGLCRRRLRHREDAEDAFQATFLVLATKARALKRPGLLGNWLFGVALRAAKEAKRSAARRRAGEERLMASLQKPARAEDPSDSDRGEALSALDEEIGRLPEKYRAAVVLCYLQGKSRSEAARQLGWPEGTVATCLTRARDLLRQRLARKGVSVSAAALTITLTHDLAAAPIPPTLAASTAQAATLVAVGKSAAVAGLTSEAAVALTKGVSTAMFVAKLKILAVLLLTAALAAGTTSAVVSDASDAVAPSNAADAAQRTQSRQRFDAVYRLAPGEVMKFIPAPFIPERGEYVRTQKLGDSADSHAMTGSLVMRLSDDGKRRVEQYTIETDDEGSLPVSSHLDACGLAPSETEGDLRTLTLEGDWIVRLDAPRDQKVKALQEILRRRLNKPALRIEKRQLEREVVVARGRLALAPEAADGNGIYIAAGEKLGESPIWGDGPLKDFFERVGGLARRTVIDETESGGQRLNWRLDVSAYSAVDDPAEFRKVLANISRQTGLRLETERRRLTVYALDEGQPAKR